MSAARKPVAAAPGEMPAVRASGKDSCSVYCRLPPLSSGNADSRRPKNRPTMAPDQGPGSGPQVPPAQRPSQPRPAPSSVAIDVNSITLSTLENIRSPFL